MKIQTVEKTIYGFTILTSVISLLLVIAFFGSIIYGCNVMRKARAESNKSYMRIFGEEIGEFKKGYDQTSR